MLKEVMVKVVWVAGVIGGLMASKGVDWEAFLFPPHPPFTWVSPAF